MKKPFRITIAVILICLIIIFMMPLFMGILHIGMIYPSLLFLILLLADIFPQKSKSLYHCKFKVITWLATSLIMVGVLGSISAVAAMGFYACGKTEPDSTVIVLGCQVRGTVPSKMLYDRMNKALKYLNENPDSKCVASGAKGSGEDISEAKAIYNYLTANGIDAKRIYIEDQSANTSQNIANSATIIADNKLAPNVVIVSDNFHQLRASIFANKNGLTSSPLGCMTFPPLTASYWAREVLAIVKAIMLGY